MLIEVSSMREINNLKTRLSAAFEMKDLGPAKQILGMKISRVKSASTLNLSQEIYTLRRLRVNDAKPRTTPLANHFKLSKEQSPKTVEEHDHMTLGFVDADLSGDVDSSKSTSGYIHTIGGTAVSWMSRLQKFVSLSSTEVEYVAIVEARKEMIWLADYLEELGKKQNKIIVEQQFLYRMEEGNIAWKDHHYQYNIP
uniref:Reverse transcriptase Ty1/copia-type domain-containing protein n=1 Tax=Solanum lycopersicum TaxID=4081 RepID=A0A3Q7GKJ6_SOLLC